MIRESIRKIVESENLRYEEAQEAMKEVMSGKATDSQIAAFLTAIRMKGETSEEITALSTTMKHFCHQIHPRVNGRIIDTCGTGGDRIKTFNISTAAAFVVSGAGISVAKHGNRSFTSKSGSADVLESLGFNLNMETKRVERNIEELGIGFMFAPVFHPAMKHAVRPRRDIGIRTVFNIIGPLANPADVNGQLLGVYNSSLILPLIKALKRLGCEEALVVNGLDGIDEVSTIGRTVIAWLRDRVIRRLEISPKDLGVRKAKPDEISGSTAKENAEIIFKILSGIIKELDPRRDIVLVNAAAGMIVGGKADDFDEGMQIARESINSGNAFTKLRMLVKSSNGDLSRLEELESLYD